MTWVAVGGAAIGAGGSIYSGQQNQAAMATANEYNVSIEEARMINQRNMYDYQAKAGREMTESKRIYGEEQLSPYTGAGAKATERQQALLGLSGAEAGEAAMASFIETPGMKFLEEQQNKATLRNLSATGGLRGGRAQTALQESAFGRAQTDYGNYFSRLQGLSGSGLQASGQLAGQYKGVSTTEVPEYRKIKRPKEEAKKPFGATGMMGAQNQSTFAMFDPASVGTDLALGEAFGGK